MSDTYIVFDYKTDEGKTGQFVIPMRLTKVTSTKLVYEPSPDRNIAWSDKSYAVRVAQAKDEHWGKSKLRVTKHDSQDDWFTRHEWSHAHLDLHRFRIGEVGVVEVLSLTVLTPLGRLNRKAHEIQHSVTKALHISKRSSSISAA